MQAMIDLQLTGSPIPGMGGMEMSKWVACRKL
jgi:hypothetical protein